MRLLTRGDLRREGSEVRQPAGHGPELAEEEVGAGYARVRAPGDGPRDDQARGARCCVELGHAGELAREELPPQLAVGGLAGG